MLGASLVAVACWDEPSRRASTAAVASCEIERRPLTLEDGTEIYIEPSNLIALGDEILVVGGPSYAFRAERGRTSIRVSRDRYLAAYAGIPARVIPNPVRGRVHGARVTVLDGTRWGVVFAEVHPGLLQEDDMLVGFWYAEYDGPSLTLLEPVPVGEPESFVELDSSALVRARDGRLVWAVYETTPDGTHLHVYERVQGDWTETAAPETSVEVAELGYDGSVVWLAVVGEDPYLPGWQKSLRLYREAQSWELVTRATIAEGDGQIWEPRIMGWSGGLAVSWLSLGPGPEAPGAPEREAPGPGAALSAHARVGIRPGYVGIQYQLDSSAELVRPLATSDGEPAWIVDHADPVVGLRQVRVVRVTSEGVARIASARNEFTGRFAAISVRANEVLVVGSQMGTVPTQAAVRSLILRLSTSC